MASMSNMTPKLVRLAALIFALSAPSILASHRHLPYCAVAPTTALSLVPRRGDCIANTYSCADQAHGSVFSGICCASGQSCALDSDGNPACCPVGFICTGTAPASFLPIPSASFISNTYGITFAYAPTSFPNAAACSAAGSQCARDFASCTGGRTSHDVVVVAPNTGSGTTTTIMNGGGGAGEPIVSVCSSFSSQACGGMHGDEVCAATGQTVSGYYIGTDGPNGAGRVMPTGACLRALVAAVGVAGLRGVWNGL